MSEHQGFTLEEATQTPQGEIRSTILWEIASRCGQVPDLHPRLLEGIEVAARKIAEQDSRKVSRVEGLLEAWEQNSYLPWARALRRTLERL